MNIPEVWLKIKNLAEGALAEWGVLALVFFLSLASFGLGRLSALEEARPAVEVRDSAAASAPVAAKKAIAKPAPTPAPSASGEVIASKNGKAYYFPWCGGAGRIAEKNKISFESEAAAKAAGYAPAKNCKGLE